MNRIVEIEIAGKKYPLSFSLGIVTIQGYGLTETSPVLTAERPWALCAGSVGTPMKSVRIYIDNPDQNGIGETGAGKTTMKYAPTSLAI